MTTLLVELEKLRRSLGWAVVVTLPVIMVLSGAIGTANGDGFTDGWHTLWLRSAGFYGMVIVAVGIGILASLVWRAEHRGGNWNDLMSRPVSTGQVVMGKAAATAVLAAAMQGVFVVAVLAAGKFYGLPGLLPARYLLTSLGVAAASVPVAALQSGLSAFLRSFALPVAVALLGAGASTMALLVHLPLARFTPYAALTQATQMGSALATGKGTVFDVPALTAANAMVLLSGAAASTALIVAATAALLDRTDARG